MEDYDFTPLINTGIVVLVVAALYGLTLRAGRRWVRRQHDKDPETGARAATLWLMIRRVILVALLVVAILMIFSIWGLSLAPFLAVGTVIGAAIGFGAQDLVKDILAGFFILAEDQFHVGDTVTIAGTTGEVVDIQFRVTVLRDLEGLVHHVPNGQITVTTNYTHIYAQPVVDIGVAYREDVDAAMGIMMEELNQLAGDPEWKDMITEPPELFGVQELADSAVVLRARLTTPADDRWAVRREAFRRVKKRFDNEGIEIPFPHVTVYRGN